MAVAIPPTLTTPRWPHAAKGLLALILVVLVGLRLYHLLLFPIYYDEALHIERAQRVVTGHTLLMGTEGGKYLQVWLAALILPLADDVLLATRILSAVFGLLGGLGCYLLAGRLFGRRDVALVSVTLYAVCPYLLFFDRLAMADGLLSALAMWCAWLSVILAQQQRWWHVPALGLCLGLALLTKLGGLPLLAFPFLATLIWRGASPWRQVLPKLMLVWLLALVCLLPTALDFAPQLSSALERSWLSPDSESSPFAARFVYNLGTVVESVWRYLTPPLVILALCAVMRGVLRRERAAACLALGTSVIVVFFASTAGVDELFPRYLLPVFPLLLVLGASTVVEIAAWLARHFSREPAIVGHGVLVGLVLLVSAPALHFDYLVLSDPPRAPWTDSDRFYFIEGPLAGYGVVDAAAYLREQARRSGRIIVVKRTDNSKRTGAWRYYLTGSDILLVPVNLKYSDPQEMIEMAGMPSVPIYVVLDRPWEDRYAQAFVSGPFAPFSRLVATFLRPQGSRIEVYRVEVSS